MSLSELIWQCSILKDIESFISFNKELQMEETISKVLQGKMIDKTTGKPIAYDVIAYCR